MSSLVKKMNESDVDIISDDDIVISGISGRFPNANNMAEFSNGLYNKIDLIDDAETRWRHTNPEIPRRSGKIHGLEKFDASFFGVNFKQARTMDPQSRLLLEHSYEAVLDSGINPKSLRGSNTGVFIGASFNESEKVWVYENISKEGFGITGSARTMLANRVSFALALNGPSLSMDTACSSSMYALDYAYKLMLCGECDAAIVGGANLLLHPYLTLQFARLGVLTKDHICRPFDKDASGYLRAEANCVMFLQKRRDARRVYATLVHSKTNCDGYKDEGITFPSQNLQKKLLTDFYEEIGLEPSTSKIAYVEAHCTSTKVGDPEECKALDEVLCKGRKKPLLVGSVKSNMGHSEPASGSCSVAKVILTLENQMIPPNLNFKAIRPEILSLVEGRLKVVEETTALDGPLVCVNSFGFGGANAHALFKANPKVKINGGIPEDNMPRLVVWSGRTEEAIYSIMDSVGQRPLDAEYVALLQHSQVDSVPANIYRGYGVFTQKPGEEIATCCQRDAQHFSGLRRSIVWVYSGMGSQWCGMGAELMKIPIFSQSIEKCHKIMMKKGLNLKQIITSTDPTMFDNILHSFVGIAAIQIALTDILRSLGVVPDHIIGHSVGELGCAYADGCFTAEEMILSAYSRGMASIEAEISRGSMAAVGIGYSQLKSMLPSGVEIACHNSSESCTISGPTENIAKFVEELKSRGVFAKEVACSNIPFHSSYIKEMGPRLHAKLNEVIKTSKKRSQKWISSSYAESRWNEEQSQFSSAQYHTNNLLSPVLFEEASSLLPSDAVIIEIAPHGLLQAILKKMFPEAVNISLAKRATVNNDEFLIAALGKIYVNGYDLNVPAIYPAIDFPVSRGTQMISPNIKWDHSEDHYVMKFDKDDSNKSAERKVKISLSDVEYEYVAGHMIDGRCLFPATGYLFLAWETLAMTQGYLYFDISVEFQDIKFLRATNLTKGTEVEFTVVIHPGTGRFEISEKSTTLVTGLVKAVENPKLRDVPFENISNEFALPNRDFYKELRLRGYHYNGLFRSVTEGSADGLHGKVKWESNWVAFLDCLLQIQLIGHDTRSLMLPTAIQKLVIDTSRHMSAVKDLSEDDTSMDAFLSPKLKNIRCGGIEIVNLQASVVGRRRPQGVPVLESYKFVPYVTEEVYKIEDAVRIFVQLALENAPASKVKIVEVDTLNTKNTILSVVRDTLEDLPLVASSLTFLSRNVADDDRIHSEDAQLSSQSDCYMIISTDCITNFSLLEKSSSSFTDNGFFICRESSNYNHLKKLAFPEGFSLLSTVKTVNEVFCVLQIKKKPVIKINSAVKISENDSSFSWIDNVKDSLKNGSVVLLSENEPTSGIIGLVNCLRKEPDGLKIQCVVIEDKKAPNFSLDNPFYQNQLSMGLGINVLKDEKWGSYRHLQVRPQFPLSPASDHCYVNALVKSDLSSLKWIRGNLNASNELVKIQYASLNFKDVMLATGKISADSFVNNRINLECVLGFEYSGVTASGKRVMGMTEAAAMATHVKNDDHLTYTCPDSWSLAEAATVPCVYVTVYAAFFMTAKIEKGKAILIHAGSGGVGLAAIRVAFAYGLDVFTTVSTEEKKQFLLNEFPQLKRENIGNSRDTSFEDLVMVRTNGKGVDYVLNSLADEKLQASIRCLGRGGKFLEIGKFDLENDSKIGLKSFLNELSFHVIMVDKLIAGSTKEKLLMKTMIEADIKSGIIKPLKTNIFEANEVEQAFRYLASGKHVGKVLLKVRENESDVATLPISVIPRAYCGPKFSYIIPGGLGGFGLELADWLVLRGCRKLVLSSSRGITKQYQAYRIKIWESYGVKVAVNTSDISTKTGCEQLIKDAMKLGPVGGIFNLAVILKDSIFDNQDAEKFSECMAPKAVATKHLDELSRSLCPELQYFVVFSSVSCGRGNAGQSNYGMANSVMERIIEQRHQLGLPAKAIQWGAVGEVGLVADMQEDKHDMEIGGTLQQRISSCLEELDTLMTVKDPIVASMVVAEKRYGSVKTGCALESVMNIMGIRDMKSFSMETTLSELGMDSLMTVEIQQTLEREYDLVISAQDLRSISLSRLIESAENRKTTGSDNNSVVPGVGMLLRNLGDESTGNQTLLNVSKKGSEKSCISLIFPGIEGVAGELWTTLASSLKGSSYVLQYKNVTKASTLHDFVNQMAPKVLELFEHTKTFNLIGYSFGSLLSLKTAELLEAKGKEGKLLLIDGAPQFLKQLLNGQIGNKNFDEMIELLVLNAVTDLVLPNKDRDVVEVINSGRSLNEKFEDLSKVTDNFKIYSKTYVISMIENILRNAKLGYYLDINEFTPLKRTKIYLIRPHDYALKDIDRDYGLSNLTSSPVEVKFVEGNHMTMLDGNELKNILQSFHC